MHTDLNFVFMNKTLQRKVLPGVGNIIVDAVGPTLFEG